MARSGVASRRASEQLILDGKVAVNGEKVTVLGTRVDPARDVVTVDGRRIEPETALHYFALHKPGGYVTTVRDPRGRPTVMELVPDVGVRMYPVGRLDAPTTGLLLLTNDGSLAHKLMHPAYGVTKRYRAILRGRISRQAIEQLRTGVRLDDGMTAPARVRVLRREQNRSEIEIVLVEGRNRQVRRMGAAVGYPVVELRRIAFGPIVLGDLTPGRCRPLTAREVKALRKAVEGRKK